MDNPEVNTNKMWNQLSNVRLIRYLLLFALAWAIVQVRVYQEIIDPLIRI